MPDLDTTSTALRNARAATDAATAAVRAAQGAYADALARGIDTFHERNDLNLTTHAEYVARRAETVARDAHYDALRALRVTAQEAR
jgi:hypothetical protein